MHMTAMAAVLVCCLTAPGEIELDRETIALGDLVSFPEGDQRRSLDLGRAPTPGLARRFHDYEIIGKLRASGFRTDDLDLPGSILVRRRAHPLDADLVRGAVRDALDARFPEGRVEILELTVPAIEVATGPIEVSAALPASFRPDAPISVRVDLRSEGFSRSVYARVLARIETLQPVLARPVAAAGSVGPEDVDWRLMPLGPSGPGRGPAEALEGMRAKADIEAGQVLRADLLYAPVLVRHGETVTVQARVGGITVTAAMEARATGKYGDTIPVRHLDGQGQTSALVTGPGQVEAITGGLR